MKKNKILILSVLLVASCKAETGDNVLEIVRNRVASGECSADGTGDENILGSGFIDVFNNTSGYIFRPEILNNAGPALGTDIQPSGQLFLESANIEITVRNGEQSDAIASALESANINQFNRSLSGAIAAGDVLIGGFEILPVQALDLFKQNLGIGGAIGLDVEVQVFGNLNGGDVSSNEFSYPIDVCNGCRVGQVFDDCLNLPAGIPDSEPGACGTFQESGVVFCCEFEGDTFCPLPDNSGSIFGGAPPGVGEGEF